MTVSRSQPITAEEEIAILQARGDLAVQNRNYWQAEAERRESEIAALKARVAELERGLTWIVNSPSAHPANMVKVAEDALQRKTGS